MPSRGVELVDRPHEAQVSLLNQVQEVVMGGGILLGDRYHQPQVGQQEGMHRRLVRGAEAANIGQPAGQRAGAFAGPPRQAAELLAGLAPPRRVGRRGIEDLELYHGIGHLHGDPRQAGQRLPQQRHLELQFLDSTSGRTAAA